jgi:hypothetical protein
MGDPRRGVGGGGVPYPPDWPPTQGGAFLQGLEGGGGGGSAGGWAPVSPEGGRGPTIILERKLLYIGSGWPVFLHYLSILLFWPGIVKPA